MESKPSNWDSEQIKRQASFMQSSLWGAFQESLGSHPHYLIDDEWSCLLVEKKTPLGKYLFAPYGPSLSSEKALGNSIKSIKNYTSQKGFDWLVFEPMLPGSGQQLKSQLPKLGAKKSSHKREPDLTRIIDLTPPAEDILAAISQSTRSLIRKNQREKFISFNTSKNPADIGIFIEMLKNVTDRNKVFFFSDEYFKKQAEVLMPPGMLTLEIALMNNKPIASALIHDFGQLSSYTFAASLPEARQTSASALLLYQVMLNAKQRGMSKIDLFGIAPDDAPASHPWAGFTSFKKKFGGEVVEYAGDWDIPINNSRYRLYRAAQSARRLKRRH